MASGAPSSKGDDPWVKFFLIGVCVTVLDLLLYPYLKGVLGPYIAWGAILLFLALGAAAGYFIAYRRGSGHTLLVVAGAVGGIAFGWELGHLEPNLIAAIIVGVAASGLSMAIGTLLV